MIKALLPRPARDRLRRVFESPRLRRRIRPARWGNLRRLRPFSTRYGFDRGTPVDRYYLDSFFRDQGATIRGHVLEVRDPGFSGRFGREITALDIVDIDPANDDASIIVDLVDHESLPAATFDCVVAPQTLQLVTDVDAAVANIWQSLRPGGSLLVTIHTLSKRYHHLPELDRWRMMPNGLAEVLRRACPGAEVDVVGLGNLLAAVAFLEGVASEELTPAELDAHDPEFPVLACGRARRSAE
jgi:hypothetical protein